MGTRISAVIVTPTLSAAVGIRSAFATRRMSDPHARLDLDRKEKSWKSSQPSSPPFITG